MSFAENKALAPDATVWVAGNPKIPFTWYGSTLMLALFAL